MRIRHLLPTVLCALLASETFAATVALLPVRRGVRREGVAERVQAAAAAELATHATLLDGEPVRRVLRRLRLRAADAALPERLAAVASELGADWLMAVEIHDAPEGGLPDLALSARLFDGRTGRMAWAGMVGRSGLQGRRLLGIGVLETLDELAPAAVAELFAPIYAAGEGGGLAPPEPAPAQRAGVLAIVPFTAISADEGVEVASTATETMRAVLHRAGVQLAEPGCVREGLRGPTGVRWGELGAPARAAVHERCGAALLVTGAVERWSLGGSGRAPEPTVAVAVRLLDAASGQILWTGSLEAGGFDRESLFGRGRVFSRGGHLRRLLERMSKQMLAAGPDERVMKESS